MLLRIWPSLTVLLLALTMGLAWAHLASSRAVVRGRATKASRDPTRKGGGDFHSTYSMLTYHSRTLEGSAAYVATELRGR